ncbi:MAG: AzlC family ABC transporter permease [Pseudomonadota bacterium]
MSSSTTKSHYLRGLFAALPFMIVVIPFALLFGVAATEAGLPLSQVMGFSVLVVAGASQFAALQFMSENAPVLVVLLSALAVNLRMAMYSASITPHLGQLSLGKRLLVAYFLVDQSYAMANVEFEQNTQLTLAQKTAYFAGVSTPICPLWFAFTYLGAVIGDVIPADVPLDFILPIAFLAMVAPALRTVAHIAAAATSILLALALVWVPLNLGLLIAGVVAMMVGAEVERRMT